MSEITFSGYVESAQRLAHPQASQWNQKELLDAARKAELRNTGWPIGLVLNKEGLSPRPMADGVEARITRYGSDQTEDYWRFDKDGGYYVSRVFEEDFEDEPFNSSAGHPDKVVWWDIRLWRITEIILHSAALYRELGLPADEPYNLAINHHGLKDRHLYYSDPRLAAPGEHICRTETASWTSELTQDYVTSSIGRLASEVSRSLFVLFDFAEISQRALDHQITDFMKPRYR